MKKLKYINEDISQISAKIIHKYLQSNFIVTLKINSFSSKLLSATAYWFEGEISFEKKRIAINGTKYGNL